MSGELGRRLPDITFLASRFVPNPRFISNRTLIMALRITLIVALLSLVCWVLFAFIFPVGVGAIHLLLAVGATLLVRWYALKYA